MIQVGDKAPLFKAEGTAGMIDLAEMLAPGPVVRSFFPKANPPG